MIATLASANAHKARELGRSLPGWEIGLLEAGELPPEVGATYYENALAKARFGRTAGARGWVLGEDSGIEVEALGGGPGIRSARWAEDGVARLLAELRGVAGEGRRARYVCELVALSPAGEELRGRGTLEGHVAEEPRVRPAGERCWRWTRRAAAVRADVDARRLDAVLGAALVATGLRRLLLRNCHERAPV